MKQEGLVYGLVFGLIAGLIAGLVYGLIAGLVFGLVFGLVYGLVAGLVAGLVVIFTTQLIALITSNPEFIMFDLIVSGLLILVIQIVGWIVVWKSEGFYMKEKITLKGGKRKNDI